jgi:protein-disulfide isomerase-like protein with CxxC motif
MTLVRDAAILNPRGDLTPIMTLAREASNLNLAAGGLLQQGKQQLEAELGAHLWVHSTTLAV